MNKEIELAKSKIKKIFSLQIEDKPHILLMNISTADGFVIEQVNKGQNDIEGDKVAAISSSLCALGGTSAKELIGCTMDTVNVETSMGQILFLSLEIKSTKAVLTQVSEKKLSLAEARFVAKRVKSLIEELD